MTLLNSMAEITFWGVRLINVGGLAEMLVRFALNSAFVFAIIHCFYYPLSNRRDCHFALRCVVLMNYTALIIKHRILR